MQSQDPESQKNLLIAVVLSMMVMLGWQYFYAAPQLRDQQDRLAKVKLEQEQAAKGTAPVTPQATVVAPVSGAAPSATSAAQVATRDDALKQSPRIAVDTPSLKGSIALKGGLIDDLVMVKYRETVDPASPAVVLFSPPSAPQAYFAKYGWLNTADGRLKLPDGETLWTAEGSGSLTPTTPVKLVWDNGEGLTFRRTIAIDEHYMLKITEEVDNKSTGAVTLRPFALLYRLGTPVTSGIGVLHEGLIGVPGDAGLKEISYSDALEDGGNKSFDNKVGGWLGITDKYWASALIPNQKSPYMASFQGRSGLNGAKEFYTTDYALPPLTVAPGQSQTVEGNLYAGAKQVKLVEGYEVSHAIDKFELLIDWGWFYFFTKPLYHVIDWLYGILGNFGFAILAVTVLVKLAFFPLANKSYESMAKMKKLQPQMEALRERFKDNKEQQQRELMALYQKEKINPLAGCLPILVQIPVFFALYKVLFVSIDMRHAPFVGWIRDLSAADPTSMFNLFGLLPFGVPEFLQIGAWPLIMGITMWVQMQLNPPQPDPIQQAMFAWMPVLFTFLLASFPAGLVIYWAWNNILSIAQQWYITKKAGAEIHLMDNVKKTFGPIFGLLRRSEPATATAGAVAAPSPAPAIGAATTGDHGEPLSRTPKTKGDALQILGLKSGASDKQINDAYNRLRKVLNSGNGEAGDDAKANLNLAKQLALGKTDRPGKS
ncbi:MAG: membrane protein insertase YidC [Hyphomicrobium sp.]